MASFFLARGAGPPSSISSTASQCLSRRSLAVGRLLSSSNIGRRGIVCLPGLERGREIPIFRQVGRLLSTRVRVRKKWRSDTDNWSPLEKLANSMESRYRSGLTFEDISRKTVLEPLLIEPSTTATTEAGAGTSVSTGNEASSRTGGRAEAGELNSTGTTTTAPPPSTPPFSPLHPPSPPPPRSATTTAPPRSATTTAPPPSTPPFSPLHPPSPPPPPSATTTASPPSTPPFSPLHPPSPPPPPPSATTTSTAGEVATGSNGKQKKSWFSETDDQTVGYWLLGSAGLVFGIVVFGGLTRLTESGLSITEWKPVTGSIPPLNKADWEEVFEKYKDSPEYRVLNPNMTLDEFKFIYYMEWTHRLWGRVIGLTFAIPAAYFIARGRVTPGTAAKLVGILGFIGFQGFIGWWMVKSGLKDDLFTTPGNTVPRVSQYRLTAHLCAAFTVYLAMLYNGLKILRNNKFIANPILAQTEFKILCDPRLRPLRGVVLGLALLTFTTAMSGGLVAGLDAGLIYNDFPKMGTGYKPPNSELLNQFYARDKENHKDLWWRNMLENPSTVQFQHRCLAMTTFSSIVGFWLWARFGRVNGAKVWGLLNGKMRMGVNGVLHLVMIQVALGISTLIYMVPTPLAVAHQAGSLALLTGIMVLGVRVSPTPKRVVGIVAGEMNMLMGMRPGTAAGFMGLRGPGMGMGNMENVILGDAAMAAKEGLQQEGPRIQRIFPGQKSGRLIESEKSTVDQKPLKISKFETRPLSEIVEDKVKWKWKFTQVPTEAIKQSRSASSKHAEITLKPPKKRYQAE